jgi:hypothetical protein
LDVIRRFTTGEIDHLSIPPRKPSTNRSLPPPQREEAHKINNKIDSRDVRLIDAEGANVGVVPTRQALIMAEEAGLDPLMRNRLSPRFSTMASSSSRNRSALQKHARNSASLKSRKSSSAR